MTNTEIIGRDSSKNKQYDHLFKIVLIGDSGVGKSSLLLRYADDKFNENFYATIGVDFRFKVIMIDGKYVKLQIWDTAGQERFKTITSAYYRGADGIFFVYDTTDKNSFSHVYEWIDDVRKQNSDDPIKYVLGNKCDLEGISVSSQDKEVFTEKTGLDVYEVSAKNNIQVKEIFEKMTRELIAKAQKNMNNDVIVHDNSFKTLDSKNKKSTSENNCC